jgi:hypothetical protein
VTSAGTASAGTSASLVFQDRMYQYESVKRSATMVAAAQAQSVIGSRTLRVQSAATTSAAKPICAITRSGSSQEWMPQGLNGVCRWIWKPIVAS